MSFLRIVQHRSHDTHVALDRAGFAPRPSPGCEDLKTCAGQVCNLDVADGVVDFGQLVIHVASVLAFQSFPTDVVLTRLPECGRDFDTERALHRLGLKSQALAFCKRLVSWAIRQISRPPDALSCDCAVHIPVTVLSLEF